MSENAWIEWSGGECPVAPDTLVDTQDRVGNQCFGFRASDRPCVGFWNRAWRGRSRDIIAYRLSGPSA